MAKGMTGNWSGGGALLSRLANPMVWKQARDRALARETNRLRGIMIKSFNNGGPPGKRWKRLSVFTQLVSRAKGHGDRRPLMRTGDLRNSHSVVNDGDSWFVGVHRTAMGRKSKKRMVNIALVHEHGSRPIRIRVTQKVRKFFMWLFIQTKGQIKPLSPKTKVIIVRIPARPWIAPIWDAEKENSRKNITRDSFAFLGIPGV